MRMSARLLFLDDFFITNPFYYKNYSALLCLCYAMPHPALLRPCLAKHGTAFALHCWTILDITGLCLCSAVPSETEPRLCSALLCLASPLLCFAFATRNPATPLLIHATQGFTPPLHLFIENPKDKSALSAISPLTHS